jgi:hypothetical protein
MSLLDKAKATATQAAAKAKESAGDVHQKYELDRAYSSLGKAAFEAIEAGELNSDKLEPLASKIRTLLAAPEVAEEPVEASE